MNSAERFAAMSDFGESLYSASIAAERMLYAFASFADRLRLAYQAERM